jgi:hypothetical protein
VVTGERRTVTVHVTEDERKYPHISIAKLAALRRGRGEDVKQQGFHNNTLTILNNVIIASPV